jgi:hypothetical protein
MSKWIVDSTTNEREHCFVLRGWIGRILSIFSILLSNSYTLISLNRRTKERLRNGEMIVPGDQWPIFLYAGYEYDPENPWKGLFRSSILVCVCV